MGNTYTRQSSFTDGDVITADLFNNEYDQLLAAFAASTGHTHDGTAAEGGPITKLLGTSITIGDATSGTDITVTFDGESNDGVFKWMEDEDYFEYSDDILIASTEKLQFRDTAIYINSSADGQLDLVADTEIQIAATTIDINGAADISGNLAVGGNLTVTGTTTFNGGTLTLGDSSADNVVFGADVDSSIIPDDDDTYDLGSASQQWRNIFIDGTAEIDTLAINGTTVTSTAAELNILDGVTSTAAEINIVDGDTSATATTVADADRVVLNDNGTMVQVAVTDLAAYFDDEITAMPNLVTTGALNSGSITSGFGAIDNGSSAITTTGLISGGSLDIDNVLINGTTIGHTDDTDLITLADGALTVAGTLAATTGTFSGVLKTDDATEATSTTDGSLQTDGGLSVVKDAVFGDDVKLLSDASVISFGANSEVTLTHVHDAGLALKHTATADDKPIVLTLQTGETDMAANDVIGKLAFQAPDEGTGTDAILVAAAVQAVAEGDFSSSNNATRLEFHTGASEAAAVKMTLNSTGSVKPVTYQETYASISAASTVDCDLLTANHFAVTLDQNTTFTFSNPPASGTSFAFTLIVTQHSTAVTLTWPNTVDWAGGSAPDAAGNNEVQAYGFITRDGGTTYYGFLGGTAIG